MNTYIQPTWPAPKTIKAYTTLRTAWGFPEIPPKSADSTSNLEQLLNLPNGPIWITQTHSNIAIHTDRASTSKEADASYTDKANQPCTVLTADCLPILICNTQGTQVAAVHAGWRGLAHGIIESTLKGLNQPAEDLLVWLGPAIGPQKFEVGIDVYNAFTESNPETSPAFAVASDNKWMANLYWLATQRLKKQGIQQIYGGEYCTHTQEDLFYSYRRDKGTTGRMASVIWISDN